MGRSCVYPKSLFENFHTSSMRQCTRIVLLNLDELSRTVFFEHTQVFNAPGIPTNCNVKVDRIFWLLLVLLNLDF